MVPDAAPPQLAPPMDFFWNSLRPISRGVWYGLVGFWGEVPPPARGGGRPVVQNAAGAERLVGMSNVRWVGRSMVRLMGGGTTWCHRSGLVVRMYCERAGGGRQ